MMMEVWNGGLWEWWQALNIICMLITSNLYHNSALAPELRTHPSMCRYHIPRTFWLTSDKWPPASVPALGFPGLLTAEAPPLTSLSSLCKPSQLSLLPEQPVSQLLSTCSLWLWPWPPFLDDHNVLAPQSCFRRYPLYPTQQQWGSLMRLV